MVTPYCTEAVKLNLSPMESTPKVWVTVMIIDAPGSRVCGTQPPDGVVHELAMSMLMPVLGIILIRTFTKSVMPELGFRTLAVQVCVLAFLDRERWWIQ